MSACGVWNRPVEVDLENGFEYASFSFCES